jgi:predicted porin
MRNSILKEATQMKKTLIAVAVGAAVAAPAAFADVTLSGSINAGPALVKSGDGSTGQSNSIQATGATAQAGVTRTGINTNYSNVTIGSLEDLGGGLKLDFAYQLQANFQSTGNGATNRNSHIGLTGDSWGGVWYGTNENLYERYLYTVDPLDGAAGMGGNLQVLGSPGYGVVFDAPGGNGDPRGTAGFYRRDSNSLWYDSPNWGGFTFGAYTTLTAYKNNTGALQNPQVYGIGGKYVGPTIPIQAWIAYEKHKDLDGLAVITAGGVGQSALPSSTSDKGIEVGGGYTLGDVFLFATFEQLKYNADGLTAAADITEYKRNAWSLGLKWNVATGYIGAQYIQAMNAKCENVGGNCNADKTGAKMVGLGYYHTLSKQTQAYIMASYIKNDDLQSYGFAGGTGVPTNLGAHVEGVTVGLKHSF